jgi:hypothetical protein
MPFFALIEALIFAAAAAAAAAAALFLSALPGGSLLVKGLRDRCDSESLRAAGERDLRSKRDLRAGSGSVWSKRDRLRGSSDMLTPRAMVIVGTERVKGERSRCRCLLLRARSTSRWTCERKEKLGPAPTPEPQRIGPSKVSGSLFDSPQITPPQLYTHWTLHRQSHDIQHVSWPPNEPSGPYHRLCNPLSMCHEAKPLPNELFSSSRAPNLPIPRQQSPTKQCIGASCPCPPPQHPPLPPLQPSLTSSTKRLCRQKNRPSDTSSTAWCRTSPGC